MTMTREPASQALLALVSGAYTWANTPTRRLKIWTDVPAEERPALFQSESGRETYTWSLLPNPRRVFDVRLFIYIAASDAAPGAPQITAIMDAIDAAMRPAGSDVQLGRQTLGQTAFNARIKEVAVKEPGDLDGDGILVITVEIMLP